MSPDGKIVTFYSYKGGTGRTMAVANIAWILASQGKKVLAIDWDFEAPGLHRYFQPFLEDCDLVESPGLIDYFIDFATAARSAANDPSSEWWTPLTSMLRYTYRLNWTFEPPPTSSTAGESSAGSLDLVPAGRQAADYGARVGLFDWSDFYARLGGGVFLEAVKKRLRERYDYVIIDSRTGIADTSGVCTVQMPDDLVICFTLNRQSINGASGVAASVEAQRLKPDGEPGVRIWPVPTRIELAEKERLERARELCRANFQRHIRHLARTDRTTYWGEVEVLYQPFYAYEEVLAVFADRPHQTSSMLTSFERITGRLTDGAVTALADMPENLRAATLRRFLPPAEVAATIPTSSVFISSAVQDRDAAYRIQDRLAASGITSWTDRNVLLGDDLELETSRALAAAEVLVIVIGPPWHSNTPAAREVESFRKWGKRIVPVVVEPAKWDALPPFLSNVQTVKVSKALSVEELEPLVAGLRRIVESSVRQAPDPNDPQKGQWGGQPERNHRRLSAKVWPAGKTWFQIVLAVHSTGPTPLTGQVVFHLHPTFANPDVPVDVENGIAELRMRAWGAFTAGVEVDDGATQLELDLALDPSFPAEFRAR